MCIFLPLKVASKINFLNGKYIFNIKSLKEGWAQFMYKKFIYRQRIYYVNNDNVQIESIEVSVTAFLMLFSIL